MLIDIGVNLTNKRFQKDLPDVLARAQENQVAHMVVTGTSADNSRKAFELASHYPQLLSSTAGVHPHDASGWNNAVEKQIRDLLDHSCVVAVGECGLDFNRDFSPRDQQKTCFAAQLALAVEKEMPVFMHERDAHQCFVEILSTYRAQLGAVVVHCFTGDREQLKAYLDMDCHIGVTGWVCDERRGQDLRDAVSYIPADRLMIETDAPYLTPRTIKPKPKDGRNEPAFLPYVLRELALLRGVSEQQLMEETRVTAQNFFCLPAN